MDWAFHLDQCFLLRVRCTIPLKHEASEQHGHIGEQYDVQETLPTQVGKCQQMILVRYGMMNRSIKANSTLIKQAS